jgi:hypothetical protein
MATETVAVAAAAAIVGANDFQFLSGLIEVCIALNFGFAISPAFRNPRRSSYERKCAQLSNALALTEKDAGSITAIEAVQMQSLVKKKNDAERKGEKLEARAAKGAYFVGAFCTALLAFVASVPMLELWFKALDGRHNFIYCGTWLIALVCLLFVAICYYLIAKHWKAVDKQFDEFTAVFDDIKNKINQQ